MILVVLAVLDGGAVDEPTRQEIEIPDGADADIGVVFRVRRGHVGIDVITKHVSSKG